MAEYPATEAVRRSHRKWLRREQVPGIVKDWE